MMSTEMGTGDASREHPPPTLHTEVGTLTLYSRSVVSKNGLHIYSPSFTDIRPTCITIKAPMGSGKSFQTMRFLESLPAH